MDIYVRMPCISVIPRVGSPRVPGDLGPRVEMEGCIGAIRNVTLFTVVLYSSSRIAERNRIKHLNLHCMNLKCIIFLPHYSLRGHSTYRWCLEKCREMKGRVSTNVVDNKKHWLAYFL